jgi:hypothetical protein
LRSLRSFAATLASPFFLCAFVALREIFLFFPVSAWFPIRAHSRFFSVLRLIDPAKRKTQPVPMPVMKTFTSLCLTVA